MEVHLEAVTKPLACDVEEFTAYVARIGKIKNDPLRLTRYLLKHAHYSPFEHTYITFRIVTSRAIGRQLLRHRSFTFQEMSQRYEEALVFEPIELRKQAEKNRQGSTETVDEEGLYCQVIALTEAVRGVYSRLLSAGVAKECARFILPECTQTALFMTGNVRSWIHFMAVRLDEHAQKEIREVASEIQTQLTAILPKTFAVFEKEKP